MKKDLVTVVALVAAIIAGMLLLPTFFAFDDAMERRGVLIILASTAVCYGCVKLLRVERPLMSAIALIVYVALLAVVASLLLAVAFNVEALGMVNSAWLLAAALMSGLGAMAARKWAPKFDVRKERGEL